MATPSGTLNIRFMIGTGEQEPARAGAVGRLRRPGPSVINEVRGLPVVGLILTVHDSDLSSAPLYCSKVVSCATRSPLHFHRTAHRVEREYPRGSGMTESDPWTPSWAVQLPDLEIINLSDQSKDAFLHHLFAYMRETHDFGFSGNTRFTSSGGRIHEWKLNTPDGQELPRLWASSVADGLQIRVVGSARQSEDEVGVWRDGILAARDRLGGLVSVAWTAILAQKPTHQMDLSGQRLAQSSSIGGLAIELLDGCFAEDSVVTSHGVGVYVNQRSHWPIRVSGSTACVAWGQEGEVLTLQRIRRLAALLSLHWDACWLLREGPRDPSVKFAGGPGPLQGRSWVQLPVGHPLARGRAVSVPHWIPDAEALMAEKPRLAAAVLMHQEGLSLRCNHSSLALVSFVAAVEAVAQVTKKPEKCPECKSVLSSRQRFEDAIRDVLTESEAEALGDAYPKRSKTVHQSQLHGTELQIGSWGAMSLFVPDKLFDFTEDTVRAAQKASRLLLLREFGVSAT